MSRVFLVAGSVSGEDDGKTIECYCDLRIELSEEPDGSVGRTYEGSYGGGLGRTVLADDGSGISLHPDVAGVVLVRILSVDSVELYFPANEGEESRFWANLVRFGGSWTDDSHWVGDWRCAPFDIYEGGWVDTVGTVSGKWSIIPE
ncbi:MAG: hypothetical protein JSV52_03440 [Candidatus Zixiibacteriota bacterium]|nr:MAG: hypothetical protein JSV52_03440 [candidate division Zixibacteria bacterium]